jgi:adenine C2-methylase RlmN of 23S rRNA A2503 and tRNA A37
MIDLKGLTPKEIDRFCTEELRQKPGQGLRVAVWLYRRRVEDFDAMTDLNRPFREALRKGCTLSSLAVEERPCGGRHGKASLSS